MHRRRALLTAAHRTIIVGLSPVVGACATQNHRPEPFYFGERLFEGIGNPVFWAMDCHLLPRLLLPALPAAAAGNFLLLASLSCLLVALLPVACCRGPGGLAC